MKPALAFVASTSAAPAPTATAPQRSAVVLPLPLQQPRPSFAEMSRTPHSRRLLLVGIAALHLLGLWGLSRVQDIRRTVAHVAPIVVRLVAPPEPPKPPLRTPVAMPEMKAPALTLIDPPLIAVAAAPSPAPVVAALPPPPPAVVPVQTAATPVIVPVAPPPAPQIKQIPASAVRYLKEPNTTVPLMSKRLRESGTVHLRIVVDVRGQPREITLAKSSGFARLDEQALQDMRAARFVPYTENGQAVEWEVIAPVFYPLDR